jgi:hypothetical protein
LRFPIVALLFICLSFAFFIIWAVMSYVLSIMHDTLSPMGASFGNATDNATFQNILTEIPAAFGIICVIFFVTGLVLIFVLDSWSDEPEYYYR